MALFRSDKPATVGMTPPPVSTPFPPVAFAAAPMASPAPRAEVSPAAAESVIGPNVAIRGDLVFEGSMRIEGKIEGPIEAQGRLTIAKGAQVLGNVMAAEAIIEGIVQGNVNAAGRIEISSTGEVRGDIRTSRLVIAEGAKLLGSHDVESETMAKVTPIQVKSGSAHKASKPAPHGDPLAQAL